jgi:hypothetical protein
MRNSLYNCSRVAAISWSVAADELTAWLERGVLDWADAHPVDNSPSNRLPQNKVLQNRPLAFFISMCAPHHLPGKDPGSLEKNNG